MAVVWSVNTLEYSNDGDKGVSVVHWRAADSEVVGEITHSGSIQGTRKFTPDPSDGSYAAYATLSEATVIGWVKTSFGADTVTEIEAGIAAQITRSKTPPTLSGIPW